MTITLDVNENKSNILLDFLEIFKKDNLLVNYKVNNYDEEVLNDLEEFALTLDNAKNHKQGEVVKIINIKDL